MVVSAPGKQYKEDTKVTDLLIRCANVYMESGKVPEELKAIYSTFKDIAEGLELDKDIIAEIREDLKGRLLSFDGNIERYMDTMKASGEDNCAKVVARYFQSQGVNACYVNPREAGLLVSSEHGNGQVLPETYNRLQSLREYNEICHFPRIFWLLVRRRIRDIAARGIRYYRFYCCCSSKSRSV